MDAQAAADEAFKAELTALIPHMRAFARSLCHHAAEADDLAQEGLLKAWHGRASYQPGTNLKAWLFTIMRTQFYSDLRSMRRRRDALDSASNDDVVPSPEHRAELMDLTAALWRLNPQYREALILVGAGGFSYEEAAELWGCAVGTMKARVSRARRQLAEAME